jgi:hypothetical protein
LILVHRRFTPVIRFANHLSPPCRTHLALILLPTPRETGWQISIDLPKERANPAIPHGGPGNNQRNAEKCERVHPVGSKGAEGFIT